MPGTRIAKTVILWVALAPALLPGAASGEQAPPLHVSRWLQAPAGFRGQWSALRGKVVVLEFWATWCSPCVRAIPHLNQLADQFRNQDVAFLAITDDNEDRLKPFLARQPLHAIIGIDPEHKSSREFAVPSIPHTVLIGKDGDILGATLPENITAEVLQKALAGQRPSLPPRVGIPNDLSWDDDAIAWQDEIVPAMYAIIKPVVTATSGAWPRPDHVTADGVPLDVLVWLAYETDHFHVDWRMPKDDKVYRAAFRVPEERKEQLRPYMQQTLAAFFGIQAHWEDEERDVYVLRPIAGHAALPESGAQQESTMMMHGKITLRRQPVSKLCEFVSNVLNRITVDETGLSGRYDFDVAYQPGQPEVVTQALKHLGMEVVKARRQVRMLVAAPNRAGQEKE